METFSALLGFVRGIHRSPVNSPHKGHWCGALMFSLIYAWINGWVNNRDAGDLRGPRIHYDATVMITCVSIAIDPVWNSKWPKYSNIQSSGFEPSADITVKCTMYQVIKIRSRPMRDDVNYMCTVFCHWPTPISSQPGIETGPGHTIHPKQKYPIYGLEQQAAKCVWVPSISIVFHIG